MHTKKYLTLDKAYDAVIDYLDTYYSKKSLGDIGSLTSAMTFLEDDQPVDPAMLQDWVDAVINVMHSKVSVLNEYDAFNVMINYLEAYRDRIDSDEVQIVLNERYQL